MNTRLIFLSYPLAVTTTAYGNGYGFNTRGEKKIANGDSCNTSIWSMSNHIGTHIDAPRHFDSKGFAIDEYPADFWVSEKITCLDLSPVGEDELISLNDYYFKEIPNDTELLLIKTGFCEIRNQDKFWSNNPGLHPELAGKLRERYPKLRILGIDTISISSYANREVGRACHSAFLATDKPILVIEDMDLNKIHRQTSFKRVVVSPLIVEGADGSPCTVIAEVNCI